MIDEAAGHHVWAERFDRDLNDIFALQEDEIARAIVSALKLKLLLENRPSSGAGPAIRTPTNLYLMARQRLVAGNHGDMRAAEVF